MLYEVITNEASGPGDRQCHGRGRGRCEQPHQKAPQPHESEEQGYVDGHHPAAQVIGDERLEEGVRRGVQNDEGEPDGGQEEDSYNFV